MKTSRIIIFAATALAFAACSNDENDNNVAEKVAATFHAGIDNMTRAYDATWETDDKIGITAKDDASYFNVEYDYAGNNKFTATTAYYYQDRSDVTFTAYYPYSSSVTSENTTITKTISNADASKDIDYLYAPAATGNVGTNGGEVALAFSHKMSKLTLTFVAGKDVSNLDNLTSYTLSGVEMNGTFDTSSGTATAVNDNSDGTNSITISSFTDDNKNKKSSLILFPQSISTAKLSATLDGQTYSATMTLPTVDNVGTGLLSGYSFNYTVTINKTAMTITKATIGEWGKTTDGSNTLEM